MMSWWKISGLALVIAAIGASCTVTSDDDDDTGGSPGFGGSVSNGGSTVGVGGSVAGSASTVGGSTSDSGVTTDAGTDSGEEDPCDTCLATNCSAELAACKSKGTCWQDWQNIRVAQGNAKRSPAELQASVGDVVGALPSLELNVLIGCATDDSDGATICDLECVDYSETGDGG